MTVVEQTLTMFGPRSLGDGLFHACPSVLRFELNTGGNPLEMFAQSWDRARAVMAEVFPAGSTGHAIVRAFPEDGDDTSSYGLGSCGVEIPPDAEVEDVESEDPDAPHERRREVRLAFPLTFDSSAANGLLWAALSGDHGIRPTAQILVYFVDLERRLLFHPYDDRGADLVSPDPDLLEPFYRKLQDRLRIRLPTS